MSDGQNDARSDRYSDDQSDAQSDGQSDGQSAQPSVYYMYGTARPVNGECTDGRGAAVDTARDDDRREVSPPDG